MPSEQNNETDLCKWVIRHFEEIYCATHHDVSYPEKDGSGPPVEVRFRLAGQHYAIEHTRIEPFDGDIEERRNLEDFLEPIKELSGKMPLPGSYNLLLPLRPMKDRRRPTHRGLQEKIIAWIQRTAVEMLDPDGRERGPPGFCGKRSEEIDGLKLELTRHVHHRPDQSIYRDGLLDVTRKVGDPADGRRRRLRRALDDKLPKLKCCKRMGDVTVLILESCDEVLSNHIVIHESLVAELAGRTDCPDQLYLAETGFDERWNLFQSVSDGVLVNNTTFMKFWDRP